MQVRQTKALCNMVEKAWVCFCQTIYIADNHPLLLRLVILENSDLLRQRLLSPKPSQAPHSGCCSKHAHTPECSSSFPLFIKPPLSDEMRIHWPQPAGVVEGGDTAARIKPQRNSSKMLNCRFRCGRWIPKPFCQPILCGSRPYRASLNR
ncbi:hypothetical protein QBD00_004137 [Ochrobactrum sp. AN78]|nr:hypothetical protein [Ochrobactrum sp. AN78]